MVEEVKFKIKDFQASVSTLAVKEGDVVIFKFDPDIDAETLQACDNVLKEMFPENQVLGLTSDMEVLIQAHEKAIDMLEKMIAKIKLLHGTQGSKLIVPGSDT